MSIKLVRITTVPISLEKLLEGQLEFMQKHFDVTAISSDKEALKVLGEERGYATFYLEMTRKITPISDLKAVYKLYRFLKRERPAIVHTHTPKAGIVGMLAAFLASVPHRLHTVAGLPLMEAKSTKRKLLDLVEKTTYKFATKVYPNSKGLYDFILEEELTNPRKLKIIANGSSNGINLNYFDPSHFNHLKLKLREELHISPESFVFIFVGRLVGDKGINELITAFNELQSKSDNAKDREKRLLLVGPVEPDLDPLKPETIEAIESNPNIISVGYQNDVRPFYAIADALVFPSYREGFPNVVMQAGAMGLPSIVSNINGCNEIIIPEVNGLVIPPKSVNGLIDAMRLLLMDRVLYQRLSGNARSQIKNRYERQQVWDALLHEYQTLLKANQ